MSDKRSKYMPYLRVVCSLCETVWNCYDERWSTDYTGLLLQGSICPNCGGTGLIEWRKIIKEGNKLNEEGKNKLLPDWERRLKYLEQSVKLREESIKLWEESIKLWEESVKLREESNKVREEGDKVKETGNSYWKGRVLAAYGNIAMSWDKWNEKYQSFECRLENGEVYTYD